LLVLLDNSVPQGLRRFLRGHQVVVAVDLGWEQLKNGKLLSAAEEPGCEVFATADQGIKTEQNLTGRRIAIVALGSNRWSVLKPRGPEIAESVDAATAGGFEFIEFPEGHKRGRGSTL
jgi:hypothetical protein